MGFIPKNTAKLHQFSIKTLPLIYFL